MDIEKVAEETPELIYKVDVDSIEYGPTDEQCMELAKNLQFTGEQQRLVAFRTIIHDSSSVGGNGNAQVVRHVCKVGCDTD